MKNKTKLIFYIFGGMLTLILLVIFFVWKIQKTPQKNPNLSQEDLVTLVKPAIVKIIHKVSGQYYAPNFVIDPENLKLKFDRNKTQHTHKVVEYISGSGFVVNPNGYILTNSHVVSQENIKLLYEEDELFQALLNIGISTKPEDLAKFFPTQNDWQIYYKNAISEIAENSDFAIKSEVTVLNPTSIEENINALTASGFEAKILSVNNDYEKNEKDVALLKIEQKNLPSLELATKEKVLVGSKIYIFGFPVTAEVNERNRLEATFTSGVVSAEKFSQNKLFKLFQTDAKISQGSSGGPMLNEKGQVIGIVTLETGEQLRKAGDNFAFAIPLEIINQILQKNSVEAKQGNYNSFFLSGLNLYKIGSCKRAVENFELAEKDNIEFGLIKYIAPYKEQCQKQEQNSGSNQNWVLWSLFLAFVFVTVLTSKVIWSLNLHLKADEQKLEFLEEKVEQELLKKETLISNLENKGIELPFPSQELHAQARVELEIPHPHLQNYVLEARAVGLSEEAIKAELQKAGWNEKEIFYALKKFN